MEQFFYALALVGVFMMVIGFLGMIIDYDFFEVGVVLIIFGLFIAFLFAVLGISAQESRIEDSVNAAAEKQNITLVTDNYSRHYLYEVIYGDCKIGAELDDGQLILAGSEPAKLLTPELVEQICSAEVAR